MVEAEAEAEAKSESETEAEVEVEEISQLLLLPCLMQKSLLNMLLFLLYVLFYL